MEMSGGGESHSGGLSTLWNEILGGVSGDVVEERAWFEFAEKRVFDLSKGFSASISSSFDQQQERTPRASPCFARIGGNKNLSSISAGSSPALKKVEYFSVRKVAGDGRCMFRALVLGMAANRGTSLNSYEEEVEADQLRLAVMDVMCKKDKPAQKYEEALIAITVEESLKRYCGRIPSSNFWGGESELLVLSRMCSQPIIVYIPETEAKGRWDRRGGYIPIAEYGSEFRASAKGRKERKPVKLLYSGSSHYDLLE